MPGLVILGVLAFLMFCLALAPARLLAPLVARIDSAALTAATGTVWAGSGRLRWRGQDRGLIAWSFRPATLLELFPGYAWSLSSGHLNLGGMVNLAPGRTAVSATGYMEAAAINPWLANYQIAMSGRFEAQDLYLHIAQNRLDGMRGTLTWSGGRIGYVLSQRSRTARLPPLRARLGFADGPEATVFAVGNPTPLLEAQLLDSGFARIGVTKRLTKMLNDPWPGRAADHEVVLAVEEKIF